VEDVRCSFREGLTFVPKIEPSATTIQEDLLST